MLQWQLEMIVEAEPFADFRFVFDRSRGTACEPGEFSQPDTPDPKPARYRKLSRAAGTRRRADGRGGGAGEGSRRARGFLMLQISSPSRVLGQFERFLGEKWRAGKERARHLARGTRRETRGRVRGGPCEVCRVSLGASSLKSVIPAFQRAQALLQEQLPLSRKATPGLWRLPGGDRAYTNALRRFTTTEFTPGKNPQDRAERSRAHRAGNGRSFSTNSATRRAASRSVLKS